MKVPTGLGTLTPLLRLLVWSMAVFNAGFYLVLPFLAVHLTDDIGLSAALVGLVMGLRMVAQQGFFLLGGLLADTWGARRLVLHGVLLRVVAFGLLGATDDAVLLIGSVLLIAVAGALFTPAVEALVAQEAGAQQAAGGPSVTQTFAYYSAYGQVGTLVGPVLGSVLLLGGFRWCCAVAAGIFAMAFVMLRRALPPDDEAESPPRGEWRAVLGNGRFLLFAGGFSGYLALYGQLYLAVPLELVRGGVPAALAGWLFTTAAIMVIGLQVPVSRHLGERLGAGRAIPLGFVVLGLGAAAPAVLGPGHALAGAALFVVLLTLGQMLLLPASREVVARFASGGRPATHFGLIGTAGGAAALLLSAAVGQLFDAAALGRVPSSLPWWLLVATAALSALVTLRALTAPPRTTPVTHQKETA